MKEITFKFHITLQVTTIRVCGEGWMEKEESGRRSPAVVWWWMLFGRICFGWEKKKEERGRGNEIELVIFILIKGIVVIPSV